MKAAKKGPLVSTKRKARGRDALIVGLVFILVGMLFFFIVLPQVAKDASLARSARAADMAAFRAGAVGEDVVVSGTLADNPTIEGDAVLLVREELRHTSSSGDSDWDWVILERNIPALNVSIDGGVVQTTATSGPVNLRGAVREQLIAVAGAGLTDTFPYQGQRIAAGSVRVFTLLNGDQVTVLGEKTSDDSIAPRELFAGSPDQLAAELAKGATVFTLTAWCFFGFGAFAIFLAAFSLVRGRF